MEGFQWRERSLRLDTGRGDSASTPFVRRARFQGYSMTDEKGKRTAGPRKDALISLRNKPLG